MVNMKYRSTFKKAIKKNGFLISILIGVAVGAAAGGFLRSAEFNKDVASVIAYPGEIFLRALKLIVLPFIISCIIIGSATLNIRDNKFIAVRVIVFFVLTAFMNVVIGISLGIFIKPGSSDIGKINQTSPNVQHSSLLDGLLDMGRNLIPENIFESTFQQTYTNYKEVKAANGAASTQKVLSSRNGTNTLGIIFFCLVFGCILGTMEKQKKTLIKFFTSIYDVLQVMLLRVIWFTPLGVASVICSKIMTVPNILQTLQQIGLFVTISISGFLFYQIVIAQLIYYVLVKKNPFTYYMKIGPAIATGFATASKAATLPIMFKVLEDDLKMNKKITKFVLPIGSIHLDGSAQYIGLAMVFLAQMYGLSIGIDDIITLAFACTVASMSSAAVPSAAIVMVTMLCSVINIPTENVALLLSVDWLVDRFRTATNVLGDCYAVAVVQQLSQEELLKVDETQVNEVTVSMETLKTNADDFPKNADIVDKV